MNFTQKSRRSLHTRVVNGQWTPHTIWSGIGSTRTDTAATEGDVIDAGAGNDRVIGSWAGDRIAHGENNRFITNSIAHYADNTKGNRSKRFKNLSKTTPKHKSCKKFKRNRPLPVIQPAQSAIEFVVTGAAQ